MNNMNFYNFYCIFEGDDSYSFDLGTYNIKAENMLKGFGFYLYNVNFLSNTKCHTIPTFTI